VAGLSLLRTFAAAGLTATILTCATSEVRQEKIDMRKFVPGEMNGWKTQDHIEIYDRQSIFDYIDGAGEIYLMYDFQKVMVLRLIRASGPTILVEIFDMGSPEDAFGIFSHAREGEEQGIGQGSEYRGGVLCFWKANFFVCITSERETPGSKKAVVDLARKIAENIPVSGAMPKLLGYLPEDGLLDKSVRYFHKHTSLNYHYFLSSENILGLGQHTEAVLARYEPGGSYLLLVRYQNEEEAKEALDGFFSAYIPEGKQSGAAQIDNGKWVAAELEGALVVVVFDASSKADARDLIKVVESRLSESSSGERTGL
jgi:hypothetical protein